RSINRNAWSFGRAFLFYASRRGMEWLRVFDKRFPPHVTNNLGRIYANTLAGPALWRVNVDDATVLHVDCCYDAGARHRREQCDFQLLQWGFVASLALSAAGALGRAGRERPPTGH